MKTTDIAWIVIFSIPLVTMNAIGHCVRQYIRDKPLGMKSLHDVVFKDMLCVVQFGCSTFCLISMMSRFESVQQLMIDEPILLTFCCASYICAYISVGPDLCRGSSGWNHDEVLGSGLSRRGQHVLLHILCLPQRHQHGHGSVASHKQFRSDRSSFTNSIKALGITIVTQFCPNVQSLWAK